MTKVGGIGSGLKVSAPAEGKNSVRNAGAFSDLLRKACKEREIKLSAHAEQRIVQRGIEVGGADIERISDAIERIAEKGGSKAAIFYRDVIFITDANDRAIITAINKDEMKERIFTGIDSAVVI